jgi:hypothetical protein
MTEITQPQERAESERMQVVVQPLLLLVVDSSYSLCCLGLLSLFHEVCVTQRSATIRPSVLARLTT